MVAQKLLNHLRRQVGTSLPVRRQTRVEHHPQRPARPAPAAAPREVRVPPIARALNQPSAESPAPVKPGEVSRERAIDRLLDELMAPAGTHETGDRPSGR